MRKPLLQRLWLACLVVVFVHVIARLPLKWCLYKTPETLVPYLKRWYLTPDKEWWRKRFCGRFLHHFYRSDSDRELHNHPWEEGESLILTGGYLEIRENGYYVRRPGDRVKIKHDTFHRVVLLDEQAGCWTLFRAGKKTGKGWGFLRNGKYIPATESPNTIECG